MHNVVVADFDNLKSAALYFDGVIPAFNRILLENDVASVQRLDALLTGQFPDGSDISRLICEEVIRLSDPSVTYDEVMAIVPLEMRGDYLNLMAAQFALHTAMVIQRGPNQVKDMADEINKTAALVIEIQTDRLRVDAYPTLRTLGTVWDSAYEPEPGSADAIVTLSGIRLIDPAPISWQHIIEVRADKGAMLKLNRLRSFFRETDQNRSLDAIADDLQTRVSDYETEAKKQGFVLTEAVFGAAAKTKGLLGIAGGILLAADQPWGFIPCAIELGGIAVHVAKASFDRTSQIANHPMAYLTHLKKIAD